jgi:serine/threonine-protein kinase
VDEADGLVFFVMALVQGESLASRLQRERKPPLPFVRHVLAQVADALAYAHRSGVVHRDIKPDNILLEQSTGRAIVTDFGIARAVQSGARLTQTGIAVGTPAFMSPEQAMGQRDVDGRSDLYSLGLVGYLMLANRLPFDAETSAGMLLAHVQGTPFPLANFRPDLPFGMVDAITRAIAREPAARWPDAAAFAAALRASEGEAVAAAGAVPRQEGRDQPRPAAPPAQLHDALDRMNASLAYAGEQLRRGAGSPGMAPVRAAPLAPAALPAVPLGAPAESRADRAISVLGDWKQRARRLGVTVAVTAACLVGVANSDGHPVFVIPFLAAGLLSVVNGLRLVRQTFRLWDVGLGIRDAIGERWREKVDAMSGAALAEVRPVQSRAALARLSAPERIALARELVAAWKRRFKWTVGLLGVSAASLAMAASTGFEPLIASFIGGGALAVVHGAFLVRHTWRLRRFGIGPTDAYGDGWESKLEALDDRTRSERMAAELARLGDAEVLQSRAGRALREAVDDRQTIRETWARLDAADREMVADVAPTADALLDRIAALATSLARLEGAVEAHTLPALEARIAEAEASPATPDQERRLSLLRRQRASLAELVERQDTLEHQLERASLALRSLRLDVVKLRALGVGSAIGDVTMATQEARAISHDIGRALDVADELRRL